MNKSKLNKIVFILVITNVIFFTIFSIITYRRVQPVPQPKTITVTDTLTQVMYDTVFVEHFETVKLPVVDTLTIINDSIRVDSLFVEVPISIYKLDTTFTTDTTRLDLFIQNKGYAVTLDTLSYSFTYRPNKTKKIHWFIGPSLGLGYDFTTGKLIPTIGIGLIIKRF